MEKIQDILIIGGGINGVGIARDATGRGLSVTLCEKSDLASGTSSASTKLIHGGLRYLEHYDFRLVRESLIEREVLLKAAPHIVRPMQFVLPHHKGLRSFAVLRLGLFIYDHLGGRTMLPGSRRIDLRKHWAGRALKSDFKLAIEYSDCWADDARLVVLNGVDAAERGANILTHTTFISAHRSNGMWEAELKNPDGSAQTIKTRALINAGGPWVSSVDGVIQGSPAAKSVRLVKGSHIVTRRLFDGDGAYIFQNQDNRIAFAIPYERDYTLIGTTETVYTDDIDLASISGIEEEYLCDLVNRYFRTAVRRDDIVWAYSGVRALYDEVGKSTSNVTRDYVLELDASFGDAPLLTV